MPLRRVKMNSVQVSQTFFGDWWHRRAFFGCLDEGSEGFQPVKAFVYHFVLPDRRLLDANLGKSSITEQEPDNCHTHQQDC